MQLAVVGFQRGHLCLQQRNGHLVFGNTLQRVRVRGLQPLDGGLVQVSLLAPCRRLLGQLLES